MNYPFVSIQKVRIGEEMAPNPSKNKEKKAGIFQWLIVIFVSLLFAALITVIILVTMGIDISKYTKETLNKVPFIEEQVTTDSEELFENNLAKKDQEISNLEEELEVVQYEAQGKDSTISELEEEIENLTTQLAELEQQATESTDVGSGYQELSESFSAMKPKVAAPIIENMENTIALPLLRELDAEIRGEILGEMEPEIAADYSDLLVNE
ncbi:MotE family protein [Gracilibacillus kekensis]|uniref:Flagellar motility protein MotE, a chaperone for MotC folding n=1 Tax=Gracilibacillus kekensis TaxID=1027249 RepID=A0A1M7PGL7_9BACI|nr:hypothetical protein [Gracilibacillus kekensis]SHN16215.1 Flagellar motility protein MotE, a chaperone for MotC folding [Gracilibacillus kekensis]